MIIAYRVFSHLGLDLYIYTDKDQAKAIIPLEYSVSHNGGTNEEEWYLIEEYTISSINTIEDFRKKNVEEQYALCDPDNCTRTSYTKPISI